MALDVGCFCSLSNDNALRTCLSIIGCLYLVLEIMQKEALLLTSDIPFHSTGLNDSHTF